MARFSVAHFLLVLCLLMVGCSDDSNPDPVTKAQQAIIRLDPLILLLRPPTRNCGLDVRLWH
jgi:hypothetical protein